MLNGERIYPPYELPDGTMIDKSGMYISIRTFFGIDIFYDGDGNAGLLANGQVSDLNMIFNKLILIQNLHFKNRT